ncbi:hypothetical protein [Thermoflexus sp.]|uniref:hypothetical protein n=1 Tax=Thermoflexus sp. TaxID=1969742 RepID=UPI0035E3FE83
MVEGEIPGLIGPNGPGKTTLFNGINARERDGGGLFRAGEPIPPRSPGDRLGRPGAGRAGREAGRGSRPAERGGEKNDGSWPASWPRALT